MAKMVPVDQLYPAFDNAMVHLYLKMKQTYSSDKITVGNTLKEFKQEFDCYLMHGQDWEWDAVGFKNEEQLSWFILKWS